MHKIGLTLRLGFCFFALGNTNAGAETTEEMLSAIRKSCSGVISILAKNGTGTVDVQGYVLDIKAGSNIDVYQEGVFLKSVTNFDPKDYNDCLLKMTKMIVDLKSASAN